MNLAKMQLRIDVELIADLRKLAAYEDRSMSNYITHVLKEHVRRELLVIPPGTVWKEETPRPH